MIQVDHQSIKLNWVTPEQIQIPKTLVLGSFNPYNPNGNNTVDYYYGRESNHFWRRIALISGFDELYFFDKKEGLNRKTTIMTNRFCCQDVISSINFTSADSLRLGNFINDSVFTGFLDQAIWGSNITKKSISLVRQYNDTILDTLRNTKSINTVIHTMGNNRITNFLDCKPKEKGIGTKGFHGYLATIYQVCKERNIEFVFNSLSPSNYAISNGATNINALDEWLIKHLNL